ncbi:MAG: PEGA domain-containing protein [Patescibacteria group bacterium]
MQRVSLFLGIFFSVFSVFVLACGTGRTFPDVDGADSDIEEVEATDTGECPQCPVCNCDCQGGNDTVSPPSDSTTPPQDVIHPPQDVPHPPQDVPHPPQDVPLPPEDTTAPPTEVEVDIRSAPNGAEVTLGGDYVCTTNCSTILPLGPVTLTFNLSGYLPKTQQFTVTHAGQVLSVALELEQATHIDINIHSSPTGADVDLDGTYLCTTNCDGQSVPVGPHQLSFTKSGYQDKVQDVIFTQPGVTVSVTLTPETTGQLYTCSFTSMPIFAAVTLDGDNLGNTPLLNVQVEEGSHQVSVSKAGYQTVNETINVTGPQSFHYSLVPAK